MKPLNNKVADGNCVYQRSSDGLKVQGDRKSIDLIRDALRSHEEVVPELRNSLAQATNAILRCERGRGKLQEAITDLLELCDVCSGLGHWGMDGERCWKCAGSRWQPKSEPKLDSDEVNFAMKMAMLGGRYDEE